MDGYVCTVGTLHRHISVSVCMLVKANTKNANKPSSIQVEHFCGHVEHINLISFRFARKTSSEACQMEKQKLEAQSGNDAFTC